MRRIVPLVGLILVLAACGDVAATTTTIAEIPEVQGLRLNAAEAVLDEAGVSSTAYDAMSDRMILNKSNWIVFLQEIVGERAVSLGVVQPGEDPNAPTTTTTQAATTTTIQAPTTTIQAPTTTIQGPTSTTAPEPELTRAEENAIQTAKDYLDFTAFSRSGLIDQLEFEGFTTAEATLAVDYLDVDWNEQAWLMAEDYLDFTSFSRSGLIDQLEFEGFTKEQATYGVDKAGL